MLLINLGVLVTCLVICLRAQVIGEYLRVLDQPDQVRKRHGIPTPMVGGIAILVPFLLWSVARLSISNSGDPVFLRATWLCTAGAGLVGFADDQSNTTPFARILSLLLLLAALFTLAPQLVSPTLNFSSLGSIAISYWPYLFLISFTAVGLVNAVNMADGQNGLVLGMYAIWSACLMIAGHGVVFDIAAMLIMILLIVGAFNLYGKLFLGDCGSYGVTFLFGILVAYAHARQGLSLETITVWFFIPVVDCVRLLVCRPLRGNSPAVPDRDHFHHRLEDRLGKQFGLATYLIAVGSSSILVAVDARYSLACLTGLAAFYFCSGWLTDSTFANSSREGSRSPRRALIPISLTVKREHNSPDIH
jgi:UDP-GlcNAc:undecaprenyl-phosphate/decaprenyl-phosphate GlcNAc-1-phosphate transferase